MIKVRESEMSRACSTHWSKEGILMEKPEGKRPLGRLRHR
jgi:hypothetical protein